MSLVIQEQAGSRQFTRSSESYTGSRTWLAYDDEGLSPTIGDIMNSTDLPTFGDTHPDVDSIYATEWDLQLSDQRSDMWEITWTYDSTFIESTGGDTSEIEEETTEPFTDINVSVGQVIIDAWKSNPLMPASIDNPARTDIGGSPLHEEGYALSMALPTADITITGTVQASSFNAGGALSRVTKRNAESWLGFDAGSVLFIGVDIKQIAAGTYQLTYKLAWDFFYHLRQVPSRGEDGNPDLDRSADPPTLVVYWKQPFPETTSFSFLPNIT